MSSAHISTHGANMTQRCHERGSLGEEGLCQASPLTVTIFYFPHIPSLEGSLFLFSSPPSSSASTLRLVGSYRAETSTLAADRPLDLSSWVHLSAGGEGMSSGFISAAAVCSRSSTSSGQLRSTLRHQDQVSGIHPEAPPRGLTASLVLSPLGFFSG